MSRLVQQVLLARRPDGAPSPEDFSIAEATLRDIRDGEVLIQNHFLSLDAGFLQWMMAGSGDNYLQAMPLDQPVMGIVLGTIRQSRNAAFCEGQVVVARTSWESWSITDGADLLLPITPKANLPLHYYVGTLGFTGFTACIGMETIGQPKPGDVAVITSAAGAVGTAAGQIAKLKGCRTIGLTSSERKRRWLIDEVGYDIAINYREGNLEAAIRNEAPEGIDIFFDNVGGSTLDAGLANLTEGARVILCGMVAQYTSGVRPGVHNLWEAVTKRARLEGFMFSDHLDRIPEILRKLEDWIEQKKLKSFDDIYEGIEKTPAAFAAMFKGENLGKLAVRVHDL